MKKLTAEDLKSLNWGDKVTVFRSNGSHRGLRFVGIMPSCKNYLIFEDGEYLESLHISSITGEFSNDWYIGNYDSSFIGNLTIAYHERKIESTKRIYKVSDVPTALTAEILEDLGFEHVMSFVPTCPFSQYFTKGGLRCYYDKMTPNKFSVCYGAFTNDGTVVTTKEHLIEIYESEEIQKLIRNRK